MNTDTVTPMLRKSCALAIIVLGAFFALALLHRAYATFLPRFSDAIVRFDGEKEPVALPMPIWYTAVPLPAIADISFTMELPSRAPSFYLAPHTGNLAAFTVNGHALPARDVSAMQDLGGFLQQGTNHMRLRIFSSDPYSGLILSLVPSLRNTITWLHELLRLLIVCAASYVLFRVLGANVRREILWMVAIGIILRSLYVSGTPWYFRGYDSQGHLDYIWHVLQTKELPIHSTLWQAHQAPLYYVFAALISTIGLLCGGSREAAILLLQSFSLLLSIATLFLGTFAVHSFFHGRMQRCLATTLLAVAPPLVFLASQISNDALLNALGFVWFFALLRSLQDARSRVWMTAAVAVSFGILTKANALLWLVPTACTYLFLTDLPLRERLKRCAFLVLISPVWAWFYAWRFFAERGYGLVANAHLLSSIGRVDLTIQNLFYFNPLAILLQPFVHHARGPFRPEYFLESLLRSAQFGTSVYESFGRYPLLFAFALIPVFFIGAAALLRRRDTLSVLTIAVLFVGLVVFCFRYPYTSSQHFRYIAVVTLPVILCIVEGCSFVKCRVLRILCEVNVFAYALLSLLFVVGIFLSML